MNLLFVERIVALKYVHTWIKMICKLRGGRRTQIKSFARQTVIWTIRNFWLPESLHSQHDFSNRFRIILEPLYSRIMDSRLRNVPMTVFFCDPRIANDANGNISRISCIHGLSILINQPVFIGISLWFRSKDQFL